MAFSLFIGQLWSEIAAILVLLLKTKLFLLSEKSPSGHNRAACLLNRPDTAPEQTNILLKMDDYTEAPDIWSSAVSRA